VNLFQIALLTVALSLDLSGVCRTNGFVLRKADAAVSLRFILTLLLTLVMLALAGLGTGTAFSRLVGDAGRWIAIILFTGVGLKILFKSLQPKQEEMAFETYDFKSMVLPSFAAGINSFLITTGIGFLAPDIPLALLIFTLLMLLSSLTWLYLGRNKGPSAFKIQPGALGGFILMGAGLHLFIKII
jgi:putative Mn2+ efflux pump MntP